MCNFRSVSPPIKTGKKYQKVARLFSSPLGNFSPISSLGQGQNPWTYGVIKEGWRFGKINQNIKKISSPCSFFRETYPPLVLITPPAYFRLLTRKKIVGRRVRMNLKSNYWKKSLKSRCQIREDYAQPPMTMKLSQKWSIRLPISLSGVRRSPILYQRGKYKCPPMNSWYWISNS